MSVLQITSREFRDKQRAYFELVDRGEKVIIKRGRHLYILAPVESDDVYISPKMELKILQAIKESEEGKTIKIKSKEELKAFLDSL